MPDYDVTPQNVRTLAVFVALLAVLTLASAARAACAWVVWEQYAPHVYQPIEGFQNKRAG